MKTTKKFTISFFALGMLYSTGLFAQGFTLPVDYIRNSVQGNNIKVQKAQGTPYSTENFVPGTVNINKDSYKGSLRYNAYNDEIELYKDGEIISLLKRPYIKADLSGKTYGIHAYENENKPKLGYFIELSDPSANAVLLFKEKKILLPAQEATSSYKKGSPARLVNENDYYLKIAEEPAKLIKLNKKSILALLKTNNSQAKDYVSKNKLKLKKVNEVTQLLSYYNSL